MTSATYLISFAINDAARCQSLTNAIAVLAKSASQVRTDAYYVTTDMCVDEMEAMLEQWLDEDDAISITAMGDAIPFPLAGSQGRVSLGFAAGGMHGAAKRANVVSFATQGHSAQIPPMASDQLIAELAAAV